MAPHKQLIGAAALVSGHSLLLINVGATTEVVTRALGGHAELLAISNNPHVASELHCNPAIEVVLAGGVIRHSDGEAIGAGTLEQIRQLRVDTVVSDTPAIYADGTLLEFDIREMQASQAFIASAHG